MSVLTFRGGIHPEENKELSKSYAITRLEPAGEVVIPMGQHIGTPENACVSVGDYVCVNQKIGEASGYISANIHSSVSGTVKAVEPRMMANGQKSVSVIIENDNQYKTIAIGDDVIDTANREHMLNLIKEAGIVGMGGAGFPTNVKLSPKNPDSIEFVIVNGAECEPYLTSDYRRMIESPKEVVEGLNIILSLFKNAKGIIAVEDNKMDAIFKLRSVVKDYERISVKTVFTKYPQGGERSLIKALTDREINSKMLPADVGCVVNNIDTVCAVYNAIKNRQALTRRIVTVSGDAINNPGNFDVAIGTGINELIEAAGGFKTEPEKIISGGPMMGTAIYDINTPITKGTSAILCMSKDEVAANEPSNCINCGRCVNACPAHVLPARLAVMAEHGDTEAFIKMNGMECCECGCCSYICPAKRNLTQAIKTMRKNILASGKK